MNTHAGMFEEAIKAEKQAVQIKKLKKQVREVQGELSIIKGIGNNSPEMKLLQKEVEALKNQIHKDNTRINELTEISKEHQQMNGKLNSELEIEKKNHTLCREDNDLLNKEIGRMMKKLQQ